MVLAAANALAQLAEVKGLNENYIIPRADEKEVGPKVAAAVAQAAIDSGVARSSVTSEDVEKNTYRLIEQHQRIIKSIFYVSYPVIVVVII